ncbi:MAG: DMT family transporter [Simkaniaceae bacterium]|nr:DMT family transporter [Candidatus Sacchlamyda saccharinae]
MTPPPQSNSHTPSKTSRTSQNRTKGIIFVLISWIFYTSVIALSRTASERTSVPVVLLFQNFIGMLFILPWMIRKGKKSLRLTKIKGIAIRTIAGYLSYAFVFLAVQRISLVNTVLLSNSAPLFIPLIIWLWRGVKINKRLWLGILLGFFGIAFILRPTGDIINVGALYGIGAAICLSISSIAKRRLVKTERVITILFYYFLISTLISIPFSIESWKPIDKETLFLLCSIGALFVCGQAFFSNAYRYEKPSVLSPFNYSSVVYGALIQWLVWGNFPNWCTIMGIVVVCTGGILTIMQGPQIPPDKKRR